MSGYVWKPAPKPRPYTQVKCGTLAGCNFHYAHGEKACPPCRKAAAEYHAPRERMRRRTKKQQAYDNADPATRRLLDAVADAYDRR